jgi:tRNA A-37 threonylcarbamoyl transferase component Bud32
MSGPELRDYLTVLCTKENLIFIIKQFLEALCKMSKAGFMGFDTSAENIIVRTKDGKPRITLVDTGAYSLKKTTHPMHQMPLILI